MCSLESSDIALFWKYNDYGSLAEGLELYLDIIFWQKSSLEAYPLSLEIFLCELKDKSKITDTQNCKTVFC